MKMEARGICQDILLHLGDLRKELLRTTALSEAIKYAQQMRRIKEDVMRIRNALPPLPVVQMPIIHPGEEKLIAFQKTVNGAIRETEARFSNNLIQRGASSSLLFFFSFS